MIYRIIILLLLISSATRGQEPMKTEFQNSALYRWLNKEVLESRILDNMESPGRWVPFTSGSISVVDARTSAKKTESKNMVTQMTHSDKKSQETFEQRTHKRLIDIIEPTAKTVDELKKLNLPAGVDITIKI
jgi:hypothetical protein